MKLKLKNFRCHINSSFEFENKGLTLINGVNGSGKSTLFKGILYALYGKIQKPYTIGKKSCLVELEYLGLNIKRTNRPNRLIVVKGSSSYEDDVAQ